MLVNNSSGKSSIRKGVDDDDIECDRRSSNLNLKAVCGLVAVSVVIWTQAQWLQWCLFELQVEDSQEEFTCGCA